MGYYGSCLCRSERFTVQMSYCQVIITICDCDYSRTYWNIFPFQPIRVTCAIETLMMASDQSGNPMCVIY